MGVLRDRCLEVSTSTGTGNFTLPGVAVLGSKTIASGVENLNEFFHYTIEAVDGSGAPTGAFEVGLGYLSSSTTLVRHQVITSSNSNALVSFLTGDKNVFVTFSGGELQYRGQITAQVSYLLMS